MKLSTILNLIIIFITLLRESRQDECQGNEMIQGLKGRFTFDLNTPYSTDRYLKLVNASGPLVLNISLTTVHISNNCAQALDFIILPNDHKSCTKSTYCQVYVPPTKPNTDLTSGYTSSTVTAVRGRCGAAWLKATKWPPTICVQRRLQSFNADVLFEFYKSPESKSSESKTAAKQNVLLTVAAVSAPTVVLLMLIIGLIYMYTKRQQSHIRDSDIAPYAVHISLRRRSENRRQSRVYPATNHYDAVPLDVARDSYYMQPVRESPYYEIDNNADTNTYIRNENKYTMAEEVEKPQDNLKRQAAWQTNKAQNKTEILQLDSNRYSGYVEMANNAHALLPGHRSESFSDSFSSVSDDQPSHSAYGEIIGVVNDDGTIERLNPPRVQYKSVKKKRKNNETVNSES